MASLLDTLRRAAYTKANGSNRYDIAVAPPTLVGNRAGDDTARLRRPRSRRDDDCTDLARGGGLCARPPRGPSLLTSLVVGDLTAGSHPASAGRDRLAPASACPADK